MCFLNLGVKGLKRKCISEVVRIGGTMISRLSKLSKAKFSILCDVIFMVRLQGKFVIDHSWELLCGGSIVSCDVVRSWQNAANIVARRADTRNVSEDFRNILCPPQMLRAGQNDRPNWSANGVTTEYPALFETPLENGGYADSKFLVRGIL